MKLSATLLILASFRFSSSNSQVIQNLTDANLNATSPQFNYTEVTPDNNQVTDLNGGNQVTPVNDTLTQSGTSLGGGVVTLTNVEYYADLSLDVRDIQEQIDYNNLDEALRLYLEGRNAETLPGVKLSIHNLNKALALKDAKDSTPPFIYHLWGLSGRDLTQINANSRYAANYVQLALSSSPKYATHGMVALNMWMYAAHVLLQGVQVCQKLTVADNPLAFKLGGGGMDEFIAVWIGQNQIHGTVDGYGLYAMAQRAGELFGKSDPEAQVNTNLKLLYYEGVSALTFPNACSRRNPSTAGQLWNVAQRIVSQMYIPLMQLLIDALIQEDMEGVHLYALAIVPQISQCKPSLFKRLKELLLNGSPDFSMTRFIIEDLQASYDCLGITCADIGVYMVDQLAACSEKPANLPIAEYAPTSFVNDRSKIDLDILQLSILTKVQAYSFAKALYQYGRNSPIPQNSDNDPYTVRTLQDFATSAEREAAEPFYSEFSAYHNDPNYANAVILDTLSGTGKWGVKSAEQREAVIVKTVAYQVMYMYALAEMADAHADCLINDANANAGGAHAWDEVAAYLIGSLEGTESGGSVDEDDGQLLWNLANQRAFQFQTVNNQGFSTIDSELLDLLFAGRGELDAYDCDNLAKTIDRIQHLLLLPIIQSTLRYSILNLDSLANSTDEALADGEVFATAVLPIVFKFDKEAAVIIEDNMVIQAGMKPVVDGPQGVANAFYQALDEFGYSCSLVGATNQADACQLAGGFSKVKGATSTSTSPSTEQSVLTSLVLSLGFAALALGVILFICNSPFCCSL